MVIGIDIDEVLFPLASHVCNFLNRKHGISMRETDLKTYDFWENQEYKIKGVQATKEDAVRDFDEFIKTLEFRKIRPNPEAVKAVIALKNLDWLVAITSRQNELEEHTRWQLGYYFPKMFQDVVFGNYLSINSSKSISKKELCKQNDVNLMIEDNLDYARELSQDIPVILFEKPWNKDKPLENRIIPVKTWNQAIAAAKYVYQSRKQAKN